MNFDLVQENRKFFLFIQRLPLVIEYITITIISRNVASNLLHLYFLLYFQTEKESYKICETEFY